MSMMFIIVLVTFIFVKRIVRFSQLLLNLSNVPIWHWKALTSFSNKHESCLTWISCSCRVFSTSSDQ